MIRVADRAPLKMAPTSSSPPSVTTRIGRVRRNSSSPAIGTSVSAGSQRGKPGLYTRKAISSRPPSSPATTIARSC